MAKSNEPIWWSLFSAGGVVAALLIPIHILLFGIAGPLGMLPADTLEFSRMQALLAHPLTRLYCFVLISLPLFHWAHRFRFTLVDLGLHGAAIAGTIVAALTLWG